MNPYISWICRRVVSWREGRDSEEFSVTWLEQSTHTCSSDWCVQEHNSCVVTRPSNTEWMKDKDQLRRGSGIGVLNHGKVQKVEKPVKISLFIKDTEGACPKSSNRLLTRRGPASLGQCVLSTDHFRFCVSLGTKVLSFPFPFSHSGGDQGLLSPLRLEEYYLRMWKAPSPHPTPPKLLTQLDLECVHFWVNWKKCVGAGIETIEIKSSIRFLGQIKGLSYRC